MFDDRINLQDNLDVKITRIKIYLEDKIICGLRAYYTRWKGKFGYLPGVKICYNKNPHIEDHDVKTIKFIKGDYLQTIQGVLDRNKLFKFLRFVSSRNHKYEFGEKEEGDKIISLRNSIF
jgi:hypothetical protein